MKRRIRQHGYHRGLELLEDRTLLAVTVFVDRNNTTGTADGTANRPFPTIQAAIDTATPDLIIKVAQGTYPENVLIPDTDLQLLGGFAGGTTASYLANLPGDFSTATPGTNLTRIDGDMDAPVVYLRNITARTVVVDGFTIFGGLHGVYIEADYEKFSNVTISRNIIENNGPPSLQMSEGEFRYFGGGIYSSNATVTITSNTIRNNNANRGGGMFVASSSDFTITDNRIENNSGYDDHGGGVFLGQLPKTAAGNGMFARNLIKGNVASKAYDYGWAGGMLVAGNLLNPDDYKPLTLNDNIWTGNSAPSTGGGLYVDDGASVILENELFYGNSTSYVGGGAIYVEGDNSSGGVGSTLVIRNSTIANNSSGPQVGNGVFIQTLSRVTVSNSIFWDNVDDFFVDETSTLMVTYTDSQEVVPGIGNISADPLFADPATGQFRLQSTAGRFDPTAAGGAGGFVLDVLNSPAIDAGDPASPFSNETIPNGGRINLGFDGNRAEASRTPSVVSNGLDFTTPSAFNVPENQTAIGTVVAVDPSLPDLTVTYALTGGTDAARFALTTAGVLTFAMAPDFETPTDTGADNSYFLQVTADDGSGRQTVQNLLVRVTDVGEGPVISLAAEPVTHRPGKKRTPVPIDAAATLNAGSPNPNLSGSKLIVTVSGGGLKGRDLGIQPAGSSGFQVKGKKILLPGKKGKLIGTINISKSNPLSLTVTFNNSVTSELVQQVMRAVVFSTKNSSSTPRTVQMSLTNVGGLDSNMATRELNTE